MMAALGMSGPVLDRRWHVMRLKSTLRRTAEGLLRRQLGDDRVCVPMLSHPPTDQERRRGLPGRVEHLFGDYIFVAVDAAVEPWVDLTYVPGVLQLLRRPDGVPQPVPRGFVEALIAAGGAAIEATPAVRIPHGTEVQVVGGPLAELNLVGTVLLSTTQRVRVLLDDVMGAARQVWLPASAVQATRVMRSADAVVPGCWVTVEDGPWQSRRAKVVAADGDMITVAVEVFGRTSTVELRREAVSLAA